MQSGLIAVDTIQCNCLALDLLIEIANEKDGLVRGCLVAAGLDGAQCGQHHRIVL